MANFTCMRYCAFQCALSQPGQTITSHARLIFLAQKASFLGTKKAFAPYVFLLCAPLSLWQLRVASIHVPLVTYLRTASVVHSRAVFSTLSSSCHDMPPTPTSSAAVQLRILPQSPLPCHADPVVTGWQGRGGDRLAGSVGAGGKGVLGTAKPWMKQPWRPTRRHLGPTKPSGGKQEGRETLKVDDKAHRNAAMWPKMGLFVLLASIGKALAQGTNQVCAMDQPAGRVECQTDTLKLVFTGRQNVPKFSIQALNSTAEYTVQFQLMFQSTNQGTGGRIGPTNVALPSLTWQFSDVDEDDQGNVEFNFTSTGGHGSRPVPGLQFRMHIENNSTSMKFDTLIDDVTWDSNAEYFVICYQLQQQGGDAVNASIQGETVSFGESAFINVNDTASTPQGPASALLVLDSGNSPCMVYERFDGSLEHDPEIRVGDGHNGGPLVQPAALFLYTIAVVSAAIAFS